MRHLSESQERIYADVERGELILRDWLAVDRTIMANERTLLAYIRTALAGVIVGGSLLKFFDSSVTKWSGIVFLFAAFFAAIIGAIRYLAVCRRLARIGHAPRPAIVPSDTSLCDEA